MSGQAPEMRFDLPQGRVVPVRDVSIVVDPLPHPYETSMAEEIERNWLAEHEANPALFDGRICMLAEAAFARGRLTGRCHLVRFATLLHWRKNRAGAEAEHIFAHAVPVSSDGALVAIRMGAQTANPGRVYFAAGSFDHDDIFDGRIDVKANMRREVLEETGIDLDTARAEFGYRLFASNRQTVLLRRYYFDATAQELAEGIAGHVAQEPNPEIEGPLIIRDSAGLPQSAAAHMSPIVDWHFSQGESRGQGPG